MQNEKGNSQIEREDISRYGSRLAESKQGINCCRVILFEFPDSVIVYIQNAGMKDRVKKYPHFSSVTCLNILREELCRILMFREKYGKALQQNGNLAKTFSKKYVEC